MAATYIKKDNEKVIYNDTGEIIYYIPARYFDTNIATQIGEYVDTLGIFLYAVFSSTGKKLKTSEFKVPTGFRCRPSYITKETNFQLEGTTEPLDYVLLHFSKGAELITNIHVQMGLDNIEKFFKLFIGGNLPDYIPYNEIQEYVLGNANLNKFSYKVSISEIGALISEIYRDPNNLSRPFRLSGMKDMKAYKAINIVKVPKYTSPYTGITSENADEAIAAAIINKNDIESPLEKVVMG